MPIHFDVFPFNHIFTAIFITSKCNSKIVQFVLFTTESLNLMAFIAFVDSKRDGNSFMVLIALSIAQWTFLIATKGFGIHFLFEIANKLIFI